MSTTPPSVIPMQASPPEPPSRISPRIGFALFAE